MINKAIIHYRDDIDLQNLIDFGQGEVSMQTHYLSPTDVLCFNVFLSP